jgi:hypothetical protein
MTRTILLWLLLLGVLAAARPGWTAAPPTPSEANTVSELIVTATKTVSELTVTGRVKCLEPERGAERADRPKVVSTYPQKGAMVRPGLLIVRVTFNAPMACDGAFTRDPPLKDPCPGSPRDMLLSYDRKTVRTVCVVEPNANYGLWMSQDPVGKSFIGLSGLPSQPYRLSFTTSAEPAVTTVCEALAQDEEGVRQIRQRRPLDCTAAPPHG